MMPFVNQKDFSLILAINIVSQITDMCLIAAEPGKPILLDCSIYPEHLTLIQEAINSGTAKNNIILNTFPHFSVR